MHAVSIVAHTTFLNHSEPSDISRLIGGFLLHLFARNSEDRMLAALFEQGLSPHGLCLLWEPGLVWLHAISDLATGLAYFAIPVGLAALVLRRPDLLFGWMFWLFALFILACGTTHLMDVWVLWHPDYGVQ